MYNGSDYPPLSEIWGNRGYLGDYQLPDPDDSNLLPSAASQSAYPPPPIPATTASLRPDVAIAPSTASGYPLSLDFGRSACTLHYLTAHQAFPALVGGSIDHGVDSHTGTEIQGAHYGYQYSQPIGDQLINSQPINHSAHYAQENQAIRYNDNISSSHHSRPFEQGAAGSIPGDATDVTGSVTTYSHSQHNGYRFQYHYDGQQSPAQQQHYADQRYSSQLDLGGSQQLGQQYGQQYYDQPSGQHQGNYQNNQSSGLGGGNWQPFRNPFTGGLSTYGVSGLGIMTPSARSTAGIESQYQQRIQAGAQGGFGSGSDLGDSADSTTMGHEREAPDDDEYKPEYADDDDDDDGDDDDGDDDDNDDSDSDVKPAAATAKKRRSTAKGKAKARGANTDDGSSLGGTGGGARGGTTSNTGKKKLRRRGNPIQCKTCHEFRKAGDQYRRHAAIHKRKCTFKMCSINGPGKCNTGCDESCAKECGKVFDSASKLGEHLLSDHGTNGRCPFCGHNQGRNDSRKKHAVVHLVTESDVEPADAEPDDAN